jgi:glycosyltransferase involved in cell wall biosynthesis
VDTRDETRLHLLEPNVNLNMRALMISPAMPALTGGGLSMRMGLFLHALSGIAETDLLVLPFGGLQKNQEQLDPHFNATCRVIPVTGREDTLFKLLSRIQDQAERLEAFRRYGRSSLAASLSVAVLADIVNAAAGKTYNVIHVGRSYFAGAALALEAQSVRSLDADENDAEVFRRWAAMELSAGDQEASALYIAEAEACERQQSATMGKFDMVFASSKNEAQSLQPYRAGRPIHVIPNAVVPPKSVVHHDDGHTLLFVGSLSFPPNREGLLWFAREVWPLLGAQRRGPLRLMIVGRDCPPEVERLSGLTGISVHSDVVSLDEFYAQATLAVVPLLVGGGTRIKIIEAALHGVPVVSTRLGAEGLFLAEGREILLAHDAQQMADQIRSALDNPSLVRALGQQAQALCQAKYGFDVVSHQLACNWKELLAKRNPGENMSG